MIFLSYTHTDKAIVDTIAQRLAKTFGQNKIFYDDWSIQPGDGIVDKMNDALEKCKFFFFFVSKKSLQSNMVKLEWQNALYKSTKEKINIIPVKIDNSMMPAILLQTLYIDVFGQGLEASLRQMIDVISGNNTYRAENGFHNIRAYIHQSEQKITIEFRAEVYMEPHSRYLIMVNNAEDDLEYKAIGESTFESGFQKQFKLDNGLITNAILLARHSATSPGFPFTVEINSKSKLEFLGVMRATSHKRFESIPIIQENKN